MESLLKLGLIYTLKCNARCSICCFDCHPQKPGKMKLEYALDLIRQAAESSRFDEVGISGGEALIYKEEIGSLIEYAKGQGLKSTLTTNGFWGKTVSEAEEELKYLKAKGLGKLIISTDDFHQPFVSYENIENIFIANKDVKIPLKINNIIIKDSQVHPLQKKYPQYHWQNGACIPMGRAIQSIPMDDYIYLDDEGKCAFADRLSIMPDGTCYPCCCIEDMKLMPLSLGSSNEMTLLELIEEKENQPYINIITSRGPKWLKEAGEEKGYYLQNKVKQYVSFCHLCHEIAKDSIFLENMKSVMDKELLHANYGKYLKI